MSKILSYTHTDTPVQGVASLALPIAVLNYGADFRIAKDTPEEAILTNLTSAIGYPEKIRIAARIVPDVYKNAEVDASLRSLNKRGIEVFVSHTDVAQWKDSDDVTFAEAKPMQMNLTFRFPADGSVTADQMLDYVKRSVSCIFETGSVTSSRINSMVRQVLIPSDL